MKDIQGYENKYAVTPCGQIFSYLKNGFLSSASNVQVQYMQVGLWQNNIGRTQYVHRLVAQAYIPNPLGLLEVNHKDGNRRNNHVSNLEWVTSSENSQHAADTGLRKYTNRMSEEEFLECLDCVINGESYANLSQRVPYKVPFLSVKLRKISRKYGLESCLDISLKDQRVVRNREVLKSVNARKVQRLSKARISGSE
jgi:hypothetical protein